MAAGPTRFAAVVVEPETIIKTDISFLKYVRDFCNKNNIILIFDEVICGFRARLRVEHQLNLGLCQI